MTSCPAAAKSRIQRLKLASASGWRRGFFPGEPMTHKTYRRLRLAWIILLILGIIRVIPLWIPLSVPIGILVYAVGCIAFCSRTAPHTR